MGAINYGSSYYFYGANGKRIQDKDITIGLKPMSDYSDEESGYKEFLEENDYTEEDVDRYQFDREQDDVNGEIIEEFLDNADLPYYFKIGIECGYYEGFYLKIEENLPWCFEDASEKADAQKDVTKLRKVLLDSLDNGLCVVYPGWCTGYANHAESRRDVRGFINDIRHMVHDMDTVATYKRKQKRKAVAV